MRIYKSDLTRIALTMPEKASEALLETAGVVVDVAKQLSPVDTGALKQSIGANPVDSKTVQVGSDMFYAPFVELGTGRSAAQSFLIPALAQSEDTFKAILIKKAQEAV